MLKLLQSYLERQGKESLEDTWINPDQVIFVEYWANRSDLYWVALPDRGFITNDISEISGLVKLRNHKSRGREGGFDDIWVNPNQVISADMWGDKSGMYKLTLSNIDIITDDISALLAKED